MPKKTNNSALSSALSPRGHMSWAAVRIAVGLLLAASGFEKLISPHQNFAFIIEQYKIIDSQPAAFVAQTLPWAELVAGAFFALGLWTRAAGAAVLVMFVIFLAVVGQALVRHLPMDECGCFGKLILLPLPGVFVMDLTLAALTFAGLRKRPGMRAFGLDAAYDRA